jgi:hypothetical protein
MMLFYSSECRSSVKEKTVYHLVFVLGIASVFATCGPLIVHYDLKGQNPHTNTVRLDEGEMLVYYDIRLSHVADRVTTIIGFVITNNSNDSVIFNTLSSIRFVSKKNILDTLQANQFFSSIRKSALLPGTDARASTGYMSNSFEGNFARLKETLRDDDVQIRINYTKSGKNMTEQFTIIPRIKE